LLHVLATLLVFRLLLPLVGRAWPAALAGAAVFAVHPAAVECVAWVSSQGDLLAVVLMLLALLALEQRGGVRTVSGTLLAALACLAKESALVLPALLLLRDLALPRDTAPPRPVTWLRTGLLAAVAVGFLAWRLTLISGLGQVTGFPGGSRLAAARGALAGLAWYARDLVWPSGFPFDLHLDVPISLAEPAVVVGFGLLATLLLAGAWGLSRGRGLLAFATLGALACLVPVSNVIVPLKAIVAERFLYPVLVCLAAGIAYALTRIPAARRGWGLGVIAVGVVPLVLLANDRARSWSDDEALWERVLRERPSHMRAYEGLGFEYLRDGRIRDAEIAYRSYLEYNPADGKSMRLLGDAFGEVAAAQRLVDPEPGETTTRGGRRLARMAQLRMYGNALRTWQRVGLVRGRGSPEMRRDTWVRVMEAAWDLGDLEKVKEANDALIALEGVDPADRQAVAQRGSFSVRRARLDLALKAVTSRPPKALPPQREAERAGQRAALLDDVGVPGRVSDAEALSRLLPLYRDLARDPAADLHVQLKILAILDAVGQRSAAERLMQELRQRYPGHPLLGGGTR
jgi:tetratricopeptide (TPR) repeat protein